MSSAREKTEEAIGRPARVPQSRHCEEPTGPAYGRPDDKLHDEAIQPISRSSGLLRFARNDALRHGSLSAPPVQLASLREEIAKITTRDFSGPVERSVAQPCIPLGHTRLDHLLGGGVKPGTLTEILSARPGDAAAASGFLLALAARLAEPKARAAIIWIYEDFAACEQGMPYGPGLALHGLDPDRLVLVAAPSAKDALWAMEEALKSPAPAAVVGELWSAKPYDLTASRRLLLAAQRHGTPALLFLAGLPGAADRLSSGADLRFEIKSHRSRRPPSIGALPLPGAAAWSVRIAKARIEAHIEASIAKARAGPENFGIDREKFHRVFWDHEGVLFRDALPVALAPVSFDRPDFSALAQG